MEPVVYGDIVERIGFTVDPSPVGMLCWLPQLYSGFPVPVTPSRFRSSFEHSLSRQHGLDGGQIIEAPRPGGDLNRAPRQRE